MARAIVWFRKGLRLHDNLALGAALERECSALLPVFVIDPAFLEASAATRGPGGSGVGRAGALPFNFLLENLRDLDRSLRARRSRLVVLRGRPSEVLPALWRRWRATHLAFEADTEPYARTRDAEMARLAARDDVAVLRRAGHLLFDPDELLARAGGQVPATYGGFCALVERMGAPAQPLPAPVGSLPPVDEEALAACGAAPERSAVPTLSELGYDELSEAERAFVPGGESEALRRLELTVSAPTRRAWVARFSKPDTSPTAFEPPSTTVLSPYMTHGCLSARRFWHAVADATRAAGAKGATRPPVSLHGQLLWREFFYLHSAHTPNFDRMVGNPLCRQIPWGAGDEYERRLRAWREARTGYPFIDAAMTQLRTQGWLHHLARHAVACFLTRGDLWVHWERGRDVFNEWLLDGDWALNNGNWMWLSASAFFHQYFRVYSPVAFPKRYDPSGRYVRRFLPQLRGLPDEFIYEPWKAPLSVQQRAGCVVGRDYPAPIVEHDSASRENMAKMKRAYDASKGVAAPSRAPKHAEPADEQDAAPRKRSRR